MRTSEIMRQLSVYGNCECTFVCEKEITSGKMVKFNWGDGDSVAIVYNDGNIAVLTDWQGGYPTEEGEIADFSWKGLDE